MSGWTDGLRVAVEHLRPEEPLPGVPDWPRAMIVVWFIEEDGALADVHLPRGHRARLEREEGWEPWRAAM